jgi:hypothetical protein
MPDGVIVAEGQDACGNCLKEDKMRFVASADSLHEFPKHVIKV